MFVYLDIHDLFLTGHCEQNHCWAPWQSRQHIRSLFRQRYLSDEVFTVHSMAKVTLRKSNMAMENGPLISDFPMKTSIHRGFSIPMFGYQRVSLNTHKEKILFTRRLSSSWWQRKDFHPAVEIVLETPNSQRIRIGNVIYSSFALQLLDICKT